MFKLTKEASGIFEIEKRLDKKVEQLQSLFDDVNELKIEHEDQLEAERVEAMRKEVARIKLANLFTVVSDLSQLLKG